MRVRTAKETDLPILRDILARSPSHDLDARPVAEEKLFGPGFGGPAVCKVVEQSERVHGVAVRCGSAVRLMAVEPEWRRRGLGTALLDDAVREIRLFSSRVVIGAAAGNYLVPGIPVEDEASTEFFLHRDFAVVSRTIDMVVDLKNAARPADFPGFSIERVSGMDENLEQFLGREFGPAIAWEVGHGILSRHAIVRIARMGKNIAGFTACEINNAGLGTFGPQGVGEMIRGRGLGKVLLAHSLADLHELGYERARIPWVSSSGYYQKACGAEIAGQFLVLHRKL